MNGAPTAPRVLPVAASYLSALDTDAEGNLWAWDAGERRIRVITTAGREVYSIRPLVSASAMPLPQQLVVLDDGSFLLAGSAQVWKFQSSGIPVWRLARIPGRPGESLPSSFDIGADRAQGSFTILDQQSRRLLAFSSAAAAEPAPLSGLLSKLDRRKPADLAQASSLARGEGLGLMAYEFAASEPDRTAARIELLWEKSTAFAGLGASLEQDLLLQRADAAYLRGADALRELSAEDPADERAPSLLRSLLASRRGIRDELTSPSDLLIVNAALQEERGDGCRAAAALRLLVRNTGSQLLSAVRIHAAVPSLDLAPALAAIESIPPLEEREVVLPMGPLGDAGRGVRPPTNALFVLVTLVRGGQGAASAFTLGAKFMRAPADRPAGMLACRAPAQDTLAASLPDILLTGASRAAAAPLADLAGVLDSLGKARALARLGPESAAQPGPAAQLGPDAAPADADAPAPSTMRASLRGLSLDEAEWSVVTASLASAIGIPSAILWRGGRPLVLIDTSVPQSAAFDAVPALRAYQGPLAEVSRGGTLWVPLSGRLAADAAHPSMAALADGIAELAATEGQAEDRAELGPMGAATGAAPNPPIPFPLVVPAPGARMSADDLAAAADLALR